MSETIKPITSEELRYCADEIGLHALASLIDELQDTPTVSMDQVSEDIDTADKLIERAIVSLEAYERTEAPAPAVAEHPSEICSDMEKINTLNLKRAQRWHPGGLEEWSLSDWYTALAGECGEVGNVVKKLNRVRDGLVGNKETPEELRGKLADELADVYLYLDLLATRAGVYLPGAIALKFNEVSKRHGFPETLPQPPEGWRFCVYTKDGQ